MKKITIIVMMVFLGVFMTRCSTNDTNSIMQSDGMRHISEWISPDGVHYWAYDSAYRHAMAPRYDNDGNLVIDHRCNVQEENYE